MYQAPNHDRFKARWVLFAQAEGYCMGFRGGKPGHRENGDVVKTHAAFHRANRLLCHCFDLLFGITRSTAMGFTRQIPLPRCDCVPAKTAYWN